MYLLLSGEGLSDIGACQSAGQLLCDRLQFQAGPMAIVIDQLVEMFQGFEMSHLETERVTYVSEGYLAAHRAKSSRKAMALKGKKKPAETKYFYENARALALAAKKMSEEINDVVIAILFRDADGTASAGRGLWQDKYNSVNTGFKSEDFQTGVAMVPKPKSEAWILCATKENPYQHCALLEASSGNDKAAHSLKSQFESSLNNKSGRLDINELLHSHTIDITKIDMPSFNCFKQDLQTVVQVVVGNL